MEIFCNRERPNYEEVVSYGPRWLTEYREMDANYKYAGWTLDLMAYWLERIVNNEFPAFADEQTISMWERVIDIEREPGMLLEERRRVVEAYLADPGKMSRSKIKTLARTYTGHDCDVYWIEEVLKIRFNSTEDIIISIDTLRKILRRRMPAHISYVINENIITPLEGRGIERFLLWNVNMRMWIIQNQSLKTGMLCTGMGSAAQEWIKVSDVTFKTEGHIKEEIRGAGAENFLRIASQPEQRVSKLKVSLPVDGRKERIDAAVSGVRRNSWRFDGEIMMDGSRYFNSLYEEEDL